MSPDSIVFDRAADYYDETRGFPPDQEAAVAAMFQRAGRLTVDSRVLEVGIGTGRIALPLSARVDGIVGVDLSRPMMDRLRAKQHGEPVYPVQANATRLPFAAHTFDAVVAVHVFHLIPGWRDALHEIARVLRPGAPLVLGHSEHPERQRDILWEAWQSVITPERTETVGVSRERRDTFLPDEGWQPVGEKQVHLYTTSHTAREFIGLLERRVWSSLWRLPDQDVARGVAAVRAAVQAHAIDLDQPRESESGFMVRAYLPPDA